MTIAQQLNIKEFPFRIKDKRGNRIYWEDIKGNWCKCEYNDQGNKIRFEHSNGTWYKREYDAEGNEIYSENSLGEIVDNRPKQQEYTMDQIAKALNINVNQLKIKK